jgi:branched-chain amino acid transport system ATP-binding protein
MNTLTPLLKVDRLATGYGDLRVVWDVSFEVFPGQITAVLGRNGAGKTTTLRAIAGLNKIASGSVEFDGHDISKMPTHARIGNGMAYVQEGKRVFHRQTVEANLVLGGYTRGLSRGKLTVEAQKMYDLFPILGDKRKDLAGSLSGGQQQMLAIGQALMAEPRLLLLDEPSGGLAPAIVFEVMDRVGQLKETGLAIVLVEQAVDAAMRVADRVTVLDIGRVVMSAEAHEIDDHQVLRDAYFGQAAQLEAGSEGTAR